MIAALFLGGCASQPRATVLVAGASYGSAPNVLLGPNGDQILLGESLAGRSAWPAIHDGFVLDDTEYFSYEIYDDQSFFDRFGGGFYHQANSTRSGVRIR